MDSRESLVRNDTRLIQSFQSPRGKPTEGPPDVNDPTVSFTVEDIKLYPRLCEVLRHRNLPLQAQYTTADTARIFTCDIRSIQERIHSGKWPARDLPKRGRFLSCDLETFLDMHSPSPTITEKPKGGGK
jgi:hypothetical protein